MNLMWIKLWRLAWEKPDDRRVALVHGLLKPMTGHDPSQERDRAVWRICGGKCHAGVVRRRTSWD
jgi:hypothetical protein